MPLLLHFANPQFEKFLEYIENYITGVNFDDIIRANGVMPVDGRELCVIGNAKSQQGNPITHTYSQFFATFIVAPDSGEIVDVEVSVVLDLTKRFLQGLFVGRSLADVDEELLEEIRTRYLGSSQKALQVVYKDAVKKYRAWKNGVILTE